MGRFGRRLFIGIGILLVALIIGGLLVVRFFDVNDYKPQIESAITKATGLQASIKGRSNLDLFPRVRIIIRDVHLANRGSELFAADEIRITPYVVPFILHREVRVDQVSLAQPKIKIVKDENGRMNYETDQMTRAKKQEPESGAKVQSPGSVRSVTIRNGTLDYSDRVSGNSAQLNGVNLDLSDIRWDPSQPGSKRDPIKSVALKGRVHVAGLKSNRMVASDLKANIRDDHGLIHLEKTEATFLGGIVRGTAQVDLREAVPHIQLAQNSSHVDLAQILTGAKGRVAGAVKVDLNLKASGRTSQALAKSANGRLVVQGQNIEISGVDLDQMVGRLNQAEGASLANIGTSLLTGVIASGAQVGGAAGGGNSGAKTVVERLMAEWNIQNGVAHAQDVALATAQNTVAFKGDVNLVTRSYENFFVAAVDPQGCAKAKIEIAGKIERPRPNVGSVGGQVAQSYVDRSKSELESQARSKLEDFLRGQVPGAATPAQAPEPQRKPAAEQAPKKCDLFYQGSVLKEPGR